MAQDGFYYRLNDRIIERGTTEPEPEAPAPAELEIASVPSVYARYGVTARHSAPTLNGATGEVRWELVDGWLPAGYTVDRATGQLHGRATFSNSSFNRTYVLSATEVETGRSAVSEPARIEARDSLWVFKEDVVGMARGLPFEFRPSLRNSFTVATVAYEGTLPPV